MRFLPAMTLGLLGVAFATPALACDPAAGRIEGMAPADGATGVPTDARLGIWWSNLDQPPAFVTVTADGEAVTGVTETMEHEETSARWTGLTLFQPDQELPAGARVKVFVDLGERTKNYAFIVGDAPTVEGLAAPSLIDIDMIERDAERDCDGVARRTFNGKVGSGASPDENGWLLIYRARPEGSISDFFMVAGRADQAPLSWSGSSDDVSRELASECFTVVQMDAAGGIVSSADPKCATLLGPPEGIEDVAGCSALPLPAALSWVLAVPLLWRRRR